MQTLLHYGNNLMYDSSVILVICNLLCLMDISSVAATVTDTVSRWGQAFNEEEVQEAVQRVQRVLDAAKETQNTTEEKSEINVQESAEMEEWETSKDEEIRIPLPAEVENATPEAVMTDDRLFLLLLWRLSHSQELVQLEAAASCLLLFFHSGMCWRAK